MRLFKWSPAFAAKCGIKFRLRAVNRQFLEREIFDHLNQLAALARPDEVPVPGHALLHLALPRLLKMEFHSLDMDPEQAIYGPPGRHVIGSVTDMSGYYDEASFDVVISNGVIGWG